ncbi:MAG TPA: methylated-DNA--[protein]-cysteine S-methyltransferase [Micromonosporaceae bacterium]
MTTYTASLPTGIGPFTIITDIDGSVLAAGWTDDVDALLPLIHPSLRQTPQRRGDLGLATRAAAAYHRGELRAVDQVPVRQHTAGPFLAAAWKVLREIDPGAPVDYTELARRTGNPAASRAAAQACARNAAALFVPCHRVVRADGSLGGFRWGLAAKRWLLAHEATN